MIMRGLCLCVLMLMQQSYGMQELVSYPLTQSTLIKIGIGSMTVLLISALCMRYKYQNKDQSHTTFELLGPKFDTMDKARNSGFSLAWNPDGTHLISSYASCNDGSPYAICTWEVESGKCIQRVEHEKMVESLSCMPHSKDKFLFIHGGGSANGDLKIYENGSVQEAPELLRNARGNAIACDPKSKYLAIASSQDKAVRIFDFALGRYTREFKCESRCEALAWSSDSRYLACQDCWQDKIDIFDVDSGARVCTLRHKASRPSLSCSRQNNQLASVDDEGTVHIWDIDTGKKKGSIKGIADYCCIFHPHDSTMLATVKDNQIQLYKRSEKKSGTAV